MSKQVQFIYQITPPGIASGNLVVFDKDIAFEITNVSNPLFELLKGLVGMVYEPNHLWDEENVCWVDWYCEHCHMRWILSTLDGKQIHIKVTVSKDMFDESAAETKLEASCDFFEFVEAIISELDRFIKDVGLLNYEQIWQKDEFPLTYFLILKKYLIEHGLWSTATDINDSNLFDEINLLQA